MTVLIPAWRADGRLEPVEKLHVHRLGLRHKAVSVFVMRGDETLLQKRAAGKYHTPGLWANACCTHPGWDEAPEACAARRLGEELGLTGLPLTHRERVEYRADVGDGLTEHEVVDIFTASVTGSVALAPDPAEVAETRWVPLPALIDAVGRDPLSYTPWLRIYLTRHRARIFGDLAGV